MSSRLIPLFDHLLRHRHSVTHTTIAAMLLLLLQLSSLSHTTCRLYHASSICNVIRAIGKPVNTLSIRFHCVRLSLHMYTTNNAL